MNFLIHGLRRRARALAHTKTPTPFRAPADSVYNDNKSIVLTSLRKPEAAPPRIQRLWGLLRGAAARIKNRSSKATPKTQQIIFNDGAPLKLTNATLEIKHQETAWKINSRARNLFTVFIGSLAATGKNERDTASCGKAKKNVDKSLPSFNPYPNPTELSRDEDCVADNPGGNTTKDTSGGSTDDKKQKSGGTGGIQRRDFYSIFRKPRLECIKIFQIN